MGEELVHLVASAMHENENILVLQGSYGKGA